MQSLAVTAVAFTSMRTSFLRGSDRVTSSTRRISGAPQAVHTTAFMRGALIARFQPPSR